MPLESQYGPTEIKGLSEQEMVPIIDDDDKREAVIGMAEGCNIPAVGALANAVFNACGGYDPAFRRINYEILGNVEPALHAHVVPRHASEDPTLRAKVVWLHDWAAAPPFSPALGALARRLAGRLS